MDKSSSENICAKNLSADRLFRSGTDFKSIGSVIWFIDTDFRIQYPNMASEAFLNLPIEEIIGRHCWELVHQTTAPIKECPVLKASITGNRSVQELQINDRWFEIIVDPVTDRTGKITGFMHIINDITEKKLNEESVRKGERHLQAILEATLESAFLMETDGRILYTNQVTARRLNIDLHSLLGANLYDFLPPDVAESRKKFIQQVIDTGHPVQFEDNRFGRIILNSIYPVFNDNGEVVHLAVCGIDITEEKTARAALAEKSRRLTEANAMLQLVIDTIPVRIFWKDSDLNFLGCNRMFAIDAGFNDPSELIGKNDLSMGWKEQAERYREDDRQIMKSGIPRINYEEPQTTPEGKTICLLTTKIPLRNLENRIIGVLGTYEDITRRKKLEDRIHESEEKYRSLFDNNHAVMLVIDPENGRIMDANPAACHYYGYSYEAIKNLKIMDINILSESEIIAEMELARIEKRSHFYFLHKLSNSEVRPVEVYSGPIIIHGKLFLYSIVHDISERRRAEAEKEKLLNELGDALSRIKTLKGLIPICASCKKIRDDKGYWQQIELYIRDHTDAEFSHGICPECQKRLYPFLTDN